jgi:hypothetical protein
LEWFCDILNHFGIADTLVKNGRSANSSKIVFTDEKVDFQSLVDETVWAQSRQTNVQNEP